MDSPASPVRRRCLASVALSMMAALPTAVGCHAPTYGGRGITVNFVADEPGSVACVILQSTYYSDPKLAKDAARLEAYRVGQTPCDVRVEGYDWVYVAISPKGVISRPMNFNPRQLKGAPLKALFNDATAR